MGDNLIEVQNLTVKFGWLTALDNVSFKIKRGEILGLIGPNGAGKSTLLGVLAGDISADSGQVTISGKPIKTFNQLALARERAVL
ncbi:hemin ABC transporter ATP-binding protein, partial [Vibrio vulnificus]